MTQTQDTPVQSREQTKSYHGQSKPPQENSKQANNIHQHSKSSYEYYGKHKEFIKRLLKDGEFNDDELEREANGSLLEETDDMDRNVIHHLIDVLKANRKQHASSEVLSFAPPKALKFVEQLVLNDPRLFTKSAEDGCVPLLLAAKFNVEILFRVFNLVIPDPVLENIRKKCDESHQSCPLRNVPESRRKNCKKANPSRSARPDGTQQRKKNDRFETTEATQAETSDAVVENLCLCNSIDSDEVARKDALLRTTLEEALIPQDEELPCLHSLIVESNFDKGLEKNIQILPLHPFKLLLQLCPDKVFENTTKDGYSPLQMAIRLYDKQSIDYEHLFSVIQALVDRSPSCIYVPAGYEAKRDEGKSAYHLLKGLQEAKPGSPNAISRSHTEELLKMTCISSLQEWDVMTDFLYSDEKSKLQLCLNLSGESSLLDAKYISTIESKSGIQFETILESVKLPYWKQQDQEPQYQDVAGGNRGGVGSGGAKVSDPYPALFRWLWKCKVRKIYTVEVDDIGRDPHTNAAIRQSLRDWDEGEKSYHDFKVEVWKWKKYDICSESILNAAPMAREVYLYSSGNTAVLRGWACCSGLPKLTELQKLTIEIHSRNDNDKKDCENYESELKRKLVKRCSNLLYEKIAVKYHLIHHVVQGGSDGKSQEQSGKADKKPSNAMLSPDEWIERLKPFKELINIMARDKLSVRVALLDDGADLKYLNGKQQGMTFRPDKQDYFVGPCSHGTEMAQCIRKICPLAELYIARLDDSRKNENQKFTTASAFKVKLTALKWANDMEVDIICMSWTFKLNNYNDQDQKLFLNLIETMSSKRVILFGSLPDKGPDAKMHEYAPVGLAGVIKICSANVHGQQSPQNIFANADFYLPGEDLKSQKGETVSGSSFSTAYATGLAALILYCLRLHIELQPPHSKESVSNSDDEKTIRLNVAKTVDGMKKIFKVLSEMHADGETKQGFFVRPSTIFGETFDDSEQGKLNTIRDIAETLLPRKSLRNPER